jgi:hypothetical protein
MKIQIENLRAQMRGVQLNAYQQGLALDEYFKLLDYVNELEKLNIADVSGSLQPLTVQRVGKMMQECSKDTWKAVQGDEHGWKEWWSDRNKLYLNSNDH